ncbi:PadR family transcriptional regulator [Antrihabitans sp. YC3-6]|uniref:PadR family transcriptional regulator n=1 Tax=Antrihabitans stalagmiti TaxID=2799499 RepID=A0A934U4Y2_9NOCA|nr:PadR family transcriptional regulator [Antrihabitans stalagmiti]MBJ8340980.1 PadR family transcriptional regulator [Antrihabitans stalagmiti]
MAATESRTQSAAKLVSPLGIAVLALLFERPMHPYEMYQLLVQRHEERNVKIRPGSLYHTVDRLAGAELVRATGIDRLGNRPERTTYEVTTSGRTALRARLGEALATPVEEYPLFPLALSEAHNLEADVVVDMLKQRIAALEDHADELTALGDVAAENGVPRVFWLDIGYRRVVVDAEITWLRALVADIAEGQLPWMGPNYKHVQSTPTVAANET